MMLTEILSRFIILVLAILHPGYKSYKSLRSKNHKEIVTWLMYWIVIAMYLAVESVADIILCWLPFYYEVKILFVLWLVLPATRGYSIMFRRLIHPELNKREEEIDQFIDKASEKGYSTILEFGAKALNMGATKVLSTGQELLSKRSLSVGDLSYSKRVLPAAAGATAILSPSTSTYPRNYEDDIQESLDFLDSSIDNGSGDLPRSAPYTSTRYLTNQQQQYNIYGTAPRSRLPVVGEEDLSFDESFTEPKHRERRRVSDKHAHKYRRPLSMT